jgi:dTDP-4-dehydrorhamnose reductase
MTDLLQACVVGGDGLLGRALVRALQLARVTLGSTSRRRERLGSGVQFLDLADADAFIDVPVADVVYLCAADPNLQRCESDPAGTRLVNVEGTCRIAERFARAGSHLVFLSSNAVFSGQIDAVAESSTVDPCNEYGRQKAEVEARLATLTPNLAVVRMTKVVSHAMPLIHQWVVALERGKTIQPFSDLRLSPISLRYVAQALLHLGLRRHAGMFHLSGTGDVSYAEFAQRLAREIGAQAGAVHPRTSEGVALTHRPQHARMGMDFTTAQTGLKTQSLDSVVADLLHEEEPSMMRTQL